VGQGICDAGGGGEKGDSFLGDNGVRRVTQ